MNKSPRTYALAILAAIYLVIRYGFTRELDALGAYASFIFEISCVVVAAVLVGRISDWKLVAKPAAYGIVIAWISGFAIFKLALAAGIPIPFDLRGTETILFLLVVAPLVEEGVFRFLLWQPIQTLTKHKGVALFATSLLFSYSHFHSIWFVPAEVHNFIIYQSVYTFLLGLACGYYVYRYASVTSAIVIHFGFNLGFYVASLV